MLLYRVRHSIAKASEHKRSQLFIGNFTYGRRVFERSRRINENNFQYTSLRWCVSYHTVFIVAVKYGQTIGIRLVLTDYLLNRITSICIYYIVCSYTRYFGNVQPQVTIVIYVDFFERLLLNKHVCMFFQFILYNL